MSNVYAQESKFEIISEVETNGQVFDHLVKARHVLSGEEGLLLCSHYSRWPAELIAKATWLAGCFTPDAYVADERLVFGAIPNQTINWEIDVKTRTVVLSVGAVYYDQDQEGVERVRLERQSFSLSKSASQIRRAVRSADRALLPGTRSLSCYERLRIVSNFLKEEARYVSGEWLYVAQVLNLWVSKNEMQEGLNEQEFEHYYFDREYISSKDTSVGTINFRLISAGAARTPGLGEAHVYADLPEEHLVISCEPLTDRLPIACTDGEMWVVGYLTPEAEALGYARPYPIDGYWTSYIKTGVTQAQEFLFQTVVIDEPEYGYARALEIPNF
jgi:hypothetical protein